MLTMLIINVTPKCNYKDILSYFKMYFTLISYEYKILNTIYFYNEVLLHPSVIIPTEYINDSLNRLSWV